MGFLNSFLPEVFNRKDWYVDSVEGRRPTNLSVAPEDYSKFLERTCLVARIRQGEDDENLAIAEKLATTGLTDDQALNIVMRSLVRQEAACLQ